VTWRQSLLVLALAAGSGPPAGCGPELPAGPQRWARELFPADGAARAGAALFATHCADCHGGDGDGMGPRAATLVPRPRDLRAAVFKYRTTRGQPTLEDLVAVITAGVPGTDMQGFPGLAAAERVALAEHVRLVAMRGRFLALCRIRVTAGEMLIGATAARDAEQVRAEFAGAPLPCPPAPADEAASARAGAALFGADGARCAWCHGPAGKGDGPQAAFLEDRSGHRAPPRDLRKGPQDPEVLFYRIRCGVGGTSMPAFDGTLTEEQIWNLAHFVRSLSQPEPPPPAGPALNR
jgi:mono/diheme cytochrome c family protein